VEQDYQKELGSVGKNQMGRLAVGYCLFLEIWGFTDIFRELKKPAAQHPKQVR